MDFYKLLKKNWITSALIGQKPIVYCIGDPI